MQATRSAGLLLFLWRLLERAGGAAFHVCFALLAVLHPEFDGVGEDSFVWNEDANFALQDDVELVSEAAYGE